MENTIYTGTRCKNELERGEYEGFIYHIVSYGTHPCCYVEIPRYHRFYKKHYDDIDLRCHGGLTYSEKDNWFETIEGWTIGWDYAHCGDWFACPRDTRRPFGPDNNHRYPGDKEWTLDELREEVKDVIEQLK